jgi:hypothetical protein
MSDSTSAAGATRGRDLSLSLRRFRSGKGSSNLLAERAIFSHKKRVIIGTYIYVYVVFETESKTVDKYMLER